MILLISIGSLVVTLHTSTNTDAIDRGTKLQNCRALFNSELVTQASTELDVARSQADTILSEGINAEFNKDDAGASTLEAKYQIQSKIVAEKEMALKSATTAYRQLLSLSITNPGAFLAKCSQLTK
jgi:hypothetical protein